MYPTYLRARKQPKFINVYLYLKTILMINKKNIFITLTCIFMISILQAQPAYKQVLFLGNSYTGVNNLPNLLKEIALSSGDTIITDENTPGGHTLMAHSSNQISLAKIKMANWDYVVLQEQSQLPSFPDADVNEMVYPYAKVLDSIIHVNNACTKTVFYMTWGRKNGDAQNCSAWPPVCTYSGMDSLLALRYRKMANDNKALLSPVGALWKYLRANIPAIELYQTDESHPSLAGSYAAACSFYAIILKKDPTHITYNGGLMASEATAIKQAAKLVVYENLTNWNVGLYEPQAKFSYKVTAPNFTLIQFENRSTNADNYLWYFGDGDSSIEANPEHIYQQNGTYKVSLSAFKCGLKQTHDSNITILTTSISAIKAQSFFISPNPTLGIIQYEFPESFVGLTYQLADMCGKVLLNNKIESKKGVISLEALPVGFYTLSINKYYQKVIRQ